MVYGNRIRQVPLLDGEEVVQLFAPSEGIVDGPSEEEELLVLTDRRLITFTHEEGKEEVRTLPLDKIDGASVKGGRRDSKPLYQGVSIILVGVLVYLVLGYERDEVMTAALLGSAIALLGLVFIGRYLSWEQGGEITFYVGPREMIFPYNNSMAASQVHAVIHRYFQLKVGEEPSKYTPGVSPSLEPYDVGEPGYGLSSSDTVDNRGDPEVPSPELERDPGPGPDSAPGPGSDESSHRLLS